jgi:hypothetical protein
VGLQLHQLGQPGFFTGGRHDPQPAAGIGQQDPGGVDR